MDTCGSAIYVLTEYPECSWDGWYGVHTHSGWCWWRTVVPTTGRLCEEMDDVICADTSYTPYAEPANDNWHYDTDTAYGAWPRCTYADYGVRGVSGCGWRILAYRDTRYEGRCLHTPVWGRHAGATCEDVRMREMRIRMTDLRYRLDRAIHISERLEERLGVAGSHARIEYAWTSEQDLIEEQRRWHDTHPEAMTLGQLVLALEDERIPEGWDLDDYTDEIGEMYRRVDDADR